MRAVSFYDNSTWIGSARGSMQSTPRAVEAPAKEGRGLARLGSGAPLEAAKYRLGE